ncbi:MAG: molybdopterin-synthase adenylyltransferase MoeB [Alphaproteobacteria bacterium]|nr:molybdopterin-synthase adenylyltransferase MoeB [Alphaproteobacteria bacterium]
MRDDLTDDELERYARHVILEEVGEEGQIKLLESKVLMVGAGGLGAPALMYLAAAGVGTIGIVDHDVVDLSNLQRQIIHSVDDIGRPKTRSAAERLELINPDITVIEHRTRLTASNAVDLFDDYDLIVDGSDNFTARYLCNDTCFSLKKPLVSAALVRFEGQLSTFKPYEGGPCYRCLFPEPPDPELVPRCDTVGIFGAIAGVMGSLQATEVLKELLGLGTSMAGQLLLFDALDQTFCKIKVPKNPDCPTCGG